MKFPNPFDAFYKNETIKEGYQVDVCGNNIDISGNLYIKAKSNPTDKVFYAVLILIASVIGATFLVIVPLSLSRYNNIDKPISALMTMMLFSLLTIVGCTMGFYREMVAKNIYFYQLYLTTIILFSIIMVPIIFFMYPGFHFVEIFGNTIGYTFTTYTNSNMSIFSNDFDSRTFPNTNIDLKPLVNVFSVFDFDDIFADFIYKTTNDNNIDFKYKPFSEGTAGDNLDRIKNKIDSTNAIKELIKKFNEKDGEIDEYLLPLKKTYEQIKDCTMSKHRYGQCIWIIIGIVLTTLTSVNAVSNGLF